MSAVPDIAELARRIQRVEDRQQMTELISRYAAAIDDRDFDALADLFMEDAEFEGIKGRAEIIKHFRARTSAYVTVYHYAHTHHFEFHGDDSASGFVSAHTEIGTQGKTLWVGMRYLDRYTRSGRGWKFQSRFVKHRYVLPFEELGTHYSDPLRKRWPGKEPQPAELPDELETYKAAMRNAAKSG